MVTENIIAPFDKLKILVCTKSTRKPKVKKCAQKYA
jgi:hypothetical protein